MDAARINQICELLEAFYQQHRHVYVPPYPEYKALYELMAYARQNSSALSSKTVECLDQLHFDWEADNATTRWFYNYYLLKQFHAEHGHTDLPFHYAEDPRLGAWVNRQKKQKEKLTDKQVSLLNQLNFTWQTEDASYQKRWETMYDKLKAFHAQHHHSMVPSSYEDNTLAQWVVRQRKKKDRLAPEQIAKLEQLGFVFDIQKQRALSWEYRYNQLLLFKQEHGHTNVPAHYKNKKLYNWVRTQRVSKDTLSKDRLKKLQDIQFEFSTTKQSKRDQQWLENFREVEKFFKEHGHLNLPDRRLYQWLYKQQLRWPKEEYRQVLLRGIGLSE